MSERRTTWVWWLPAVLWMALIFIGSTDLLSDDHTSRFLAPFLRWLFPGISETAIEALRALIRKSGHVVEYAVLAGCVGAAWQRSFRPWRWRWDWLLVGRVLGICLLYAVSDEWHQSFVPSRLGCARDVFIDLAGAAGGLAAWWCLGWLIGRRFREQPAKGIVSLGEEGPPGATGQGSDQAVS